LRFRLSEQWLSEGAFEKEGGRPRKQLQNLSLFKPEQHAVARGVVMEILSLRPSQHSTSELDCILAAFSSHLLLDFGSSQKGSTAQPWDSASS